MIANTKKSIMASEKDVRATMYNQEINVARGRTTIAVVGNELSIGVIVTALLRRTDVAINACTSIATPKPITKPQSSLNCIIVYIKSPSKYEAPAIPYEKLSMPYFRTQSL